MSNALDHTDPSLAEILYPGVTDEPLYGQSLLESIRQPQDHSPVAIKAWLNTVIQAFEVKPTSWAKEAGLAPSTINRFLKHKDPNANLSASTIDKLKRALPSQIEDHVKSFWDKQSENNLRQFSIEAILTEAEMLGFITDDPSELIFAGEGRDAELVEYLSGLRRCLTVPVPRGYARSKCVAFEVSCHSYAPLYPDLTILICVPLYLYIGNPPNGAHVIVQEKLDQRRTHTTVRLYAEDPSGRSWLMPFSSQPSQNERAIYVDDIVGENGPKATFLVIASYRYQQAIREAQKSA